MYFCFIIALFTTLYWVDSLIITVVNAKVNPYSKNADDEKIMKNRTIIRLVSLLLSTIFWGVIFIFGK